MVEQEPLWDHTVI